MWVGGGRGLMLDRGVFICGPSLAAVKQDPPLFLLLHTDDRTIESFHLTTKSFANLLAVREDLQSSANSFLVAEYLRLDARTPPSRAFDDSWQSLQRNASHWEKYVSAGS